MANLIVKDGAADTKYIKGTGAGTDGDPFVAEHLVSGTATVANALLGAATSDAAVVTDATGSIHQYLRGLVKLIVAKINVATIDTLTTITNAVGITNALLGGATSDAAVITDATGSIHQYLRGLVKLIAAKINIATVDAVTTITNAVGITNALLGSATSDAAVITDATGSIHQYLRGLVKLIVAKINIATVDTVTTVTTVSTLTTVTNTVPTKGTGFSIPVTLTVTNGAYTIGDVVGGLITLANAVSANGKSCIINTIKLSGVSAIAYELWFYNADIGTNAADNAPLTLVAADGAKSLGGVPISTADYMAAASAFNDATVRGVGLEVKAGAATTSIYAYMKATATTSPGTTTLYLLVAGEFVD